MTSRGLLFRDAVTFFALTLLTVGLFLVTLFLFRSFAAHRQELGRLWSERGYAAMAGGRPEQAIVPLRTALTYQPGQREYELHLAEALAEAGHTEEAFNYFSGLWDTQPGSGIINLQLARLSTKRDAQKAIEYYRAAIYGTWEGDGVSRRRDVRLELIRYLLAEKNPAAARAELLIASGNADGDTALELELGGLFEEAGDRADAMEIYRRSIEGAGASDAPLLAAGRLAYTMGDYRSSQTFLSEAKHRRSGRSEPNALDDSDAQLLRSSERILELFPSNALSREERLTRLLSLRDIASRRLGRCAQTGPSDRLQDLAGRWAAAQPEFSRRMLLRSPAGQDQLLPLVYETAVLTAQICGAPTGDDAALLRIAQHAKTVEQ